MLSPAPLALKTSILISSGRNSTSTSSSNSGITLTEANDVCRRPAESKGEIRTKRWTPFSPRKYPYALCP